MIRKTQQDLIALQKDIEKAGTPKKYGYMKVPAIAAWYELTKEMTTYISVVFTMYYHVCFPTYLANRVIDEKHSVKCLLNAIDSMYNLYLHRTLDMDSCIETVRNGEKIHHTVLDHIDEMRRKISTMASHVRTAYAQTLDKLARDYSAVSSRYTDASNAVFRYLESSFTYLRTPLTFRIDYDAIAMHYADAIAETVLLMKRLLGFDKDDVVYGQYVRTIQHVQKQIDDSIPIVKKICTSEYASEMKHVSVNNGVAGVKLAMDMLITNSADYQSDPHNAVFRTKVGVLTANLAVSLCSVDLHGRCVTGPSMKFEYINDIEVCIKKIIMKYFVCRRDEMDDVIRKLMTLTMKDPNIAENLIVLEKNFKQVSKDAADVFKTNTDPDNPEHVKACLYSSDTIQLGMNAMVIMLSKCKMSNEIESCVTMINAFYMTIKCATQTWRHLHQLELLQLHAMLHRCMTLITYVSKFEDHHREPLQIPTQEGQRVIDRLTEVRKFFATWNKESSPLAAELLNTLPRGFYSHWTKHEQEELCKLLAADSKTFNKIMGFKLLLAAPLLGFWRTFHYKITPGKAVQEKWCLLYTNYFVTICNRIDKMYTDKTNESCEYSFGYTTELLIVMWNSCYTILHWIYDILNTLTTGAVDHAQVMKITSHTYELTEYLLNCPYLVSHATQLRELTTEMFKQAQLRAVKNDREIRQTVITHLTDIYTLVQTLLQSINPLMDSFQQTGQNTHKPVPQQSQTSMASNVERSPSQSPIMKMPQISDAAVSLTSNQSLQQLLDQLVNVQKTPSEGNDAALGTQESPLKQLLMKIHAAESRTTQPRTLADLLDHLAQPVNRKPRHVIKKPKNRKSDRIADYIVSVNDIMYKAKLGRGSYGEVSLAQVGGTQVAVKAITLSEEVSSMNTTAFMKEIEILIHLWHPCIVEIIGVVCPTGSDTGLILTEFASNGSLSDILTKVRNDEAPTFWNPTLAAKIIVGCACGMRYTHSRGIWHRDLKPGNILLDHDFQVKICDFGASRFDDITGTETHSVGTPAYMAPEISDDCPYDWRVDVYSFAIILFELLTGEPVFPRNWKVIQIIRRAMTKQRPEIPTKIHERVRAIISKCWSPDPAERLSFEEIVRTFEEINFLFTPDVASHDVKDYYDAICAWESQ